MTRPDRRAASLLKALILIGAIVLPGGCATLAPRDAETLAGLMTGTFSSRDQAAQDHRYEAYQITAGPIWPTRADGPWLYLEQAAAEKPDAPYRQRVYHLTDLGDGAVRVDMFTLKAPRQAQGAQANAGAMIAQGDLEPLPGCDLTFRRGADGIWRGTTRDTDCRNTYKNSAYMVSRAEIDGAGWMNWDRGFGADGALVWGPAAGGYQFKRRPPDANPPAANPPAVPAPKPAAALDPARCDDKPVLMVVEGRTIDRERIAAYGRAIRDLGLYPALGGYYLNNPRPVAVFEGSFGADRSILIVRFPCYAHARAFWYSKTYQETLVPLRRDPDAGEFTVTIHAEAPPPDYMAGRVGDDSYVGRQDPAALGAVPQTAAGMGAPRP